MKKPNYRLQSRYADGSESEPEVYELEEIDHTMKLSRRGFIALSALAAVMAAGCSSPTTTSSPVPEPATGLAHSTYVTSVAFNPDGTKLATGSIDKTIKIWGVESGTLLNKIAVIDKPVDSIAFSPDGTKIASGSKQNIMIWDVATGSLKKMLTPEEGWIAAAGSAAFSPDGKKIASINSGTILIWDVESGTLLIELPGNHYMVDSIAFSPDGTKIISGSSEGTIKIWDVQTGFLQKTLTGHTL